MRHHICDGKIIAEEKIFEAECCEENQAAGGHPGLPCALDQQRVARNDRGNASAKCINCADKRQDECKGAEYIHNNPPIPRRSRAPYIPLRSVGLAAAPPLPPGAASYLDRKSTRLNSSHSQISYAVFCLKKKNITYRHRHY